MPKKIEQENPRPRQDQLASELLAEISRTLEANAAMVKLLLNAGKAAPAGVVDDFALNAVANSTDLSASTGSDETLRALARTQGLGEPMERLIKLRQERYPDTRPRYWAIVDFDRPSTKPRMVVFDTAENSAVSYLCAHGKGSEGAKDDGMAEVFSNKKKSNATSLGIYRCAETYEGKNGYSLRLDGLEGSNDNARARHIVVHGAPYVSEDFIKEHGRIGRSEGCPALDHRYARTVIDQLKLGSLLLHWKTP